MNWIKARLNKDNFWNVIFLGGMTFGMSLTGFFASMNVAPLAFLSFWATLIIIPSLICNFNSVHFANKEFFNLQGQKLDKYPSNLFWLIASTLLAVALSGALIDAHAKNLSNPIAFSILITVFFAVPTLYFIILNCPISILFNKYLWKLEVTKTNTKNRRIYRTSSNPYHESLFDISRRESPITGASYSGLSCNVRNSNHWK